MRKKTIALLVIFAVIASIGIVVASTTPTFNHPGFQTRGWDIEMNNLNLTDAYNVSSQYATISENLTAKTGRTATVTVAASDSSATSKAQADYVCNGFDDQDTINTAINSISSSYGEIALLEGTFNCTDYVRMTKNNISLTGHGAVLRLADNSDYVGILLIIANNTRVIGLTIDGNKANQVHEVHAIRVGSVANTKNYQISLCHIHHASGDGIEVVGPTTNVKITNNIFHDCLEQEVHIDGGINIIIANNIMYNDECDAISVTATLYKMENITISNNLVYGSKYGINIDAEWGTKPVNNVRIIGNQIFENTYEGIFIGENASSISVIGNTIKDNGRFGIKSRSNSISISDNLIQNNVDGGIFISGTTSSTRGIVQINNNKILNHIHSTTSCGGICVYTPQSTSKVIIDSNTIFNNDRYGIYLKDSCHFIQITGNHIYNNSQTSSDTYTGIHGWATSDFNNTIIMNNIIDGGGNHRFGIYLNGASGKFKNLSIINNIITNSASGSIYLNFNRIENATFDCRHNTGYITENSGSSSVANNSIIAHGCSATPTSVTLTSTNASNIVAATTVNSTHITIGMQDYTSNIVTATETIYWYAKVR